MARNPMLIWQSVLAGLQVLTASADLGSLIGPTVTGIVVLVVAAAQVATAFYLTGGPTATNDKGGSWPGTNPGGSSNPSTA